MAPQAGSRGSKRRPAVGPARHSFGGVLQGGALGSVRLAHLVGIGGVGMSGVARLLVEAGWAVSGSEEGLYPPTSTALEELGVPVAMPYAAGNIPKGAALIVLGKHARLQRGNAEVDAALASGIKVVSFPEVVAELFASGKQLVVAGTHGKSTTTSLVAAILEHVGCAPGYLIGAVLEGIPSSRLGAGRVAVIEGDEYPSSNFDPTPKFLHLHPQCVLLTAAALDHVDVYRSHQEYLGAFERLIDRLPHDGLLVACEEDRFASDLAKRAPCRVVTYGVEAGDYHARKASWTEAVSLDLVGRGATLAHVEAPLFGRHNVQNIVGAAAMALEGGFAQSSDIGAAARRFSLPRRRLVDHGRLLFEDIASSPTKMAASLAALADRFPGRRLVVIFEPYSRTWRHPLVLPQLGAAFSRSDLVILSRPRALGKATGVVQSSAEAVMAELAQAGIPTVATDGGGELENALRAHLRGGEVVLLATSGEAGSLLSLVRSAMSMGAAA